MRQTKLFLKTSKEKPKGADSVSAELLLRGGFIDKLSAGIYNFLPLGLRSMRKIENIIRQEMDKIGGEEILMPVLHPRSLWEESGRWNKMDPPLFKLEDRHNKEYALGSTHEEVITQIVRQRVSSYKELPFILYQIQDKFRNEMRSTGGLLRTREFVMKDAYSFHADSQDLASFYEKASDAYMNIFKHLNLTAARVEAASGSIGGKVSHEFMVLSETGEDEILMCKCGYAVNVEAGKAEKCAKCDTELMSKKAIEVGHIFQLGDKYSKAMQANFVAKNGQQKQILMGCYGIGIGRLMATVVEASHDENGIIWPASGSPFDMHLINLAKEPKEADKIYQKLSKNYDVLYDDRDISAGEKLAEADLLGISKRVVVSDKTIKQNKIELKLRGEKEAKLITIAELLK